MNVSEGLVKAYPAPLRRLIAYFGLGSSRAPCSWRGHVETMEPCMRKGSLLAGLGAAVLLAACAEKPTPTPRPIPVAPVPVIGPPPVQRAPAPDWRDLDLTAGIWFYDGTSARFLASDSAAFALRCDSATRRMFLEREGSAGEMTIRTTEGERRFAGGRAPLPVGDPFLDSIVFSRGRFVVETAERTLVIPAWPEPARALEDCRN
jgi:hypothetical protein